MKEILVTGGAGFIGAHLCEALIAKNYDVTVLDDLSAGSQNKKLLGDAGVNLIEADIREIDVVKKAVKDIDIVLHLAAMNRAARSIANPIEANDVNVNGTLYLLEAARHAQVDGFVFASSSSVYGNSTLVNKEDAPTYPVHPYGVGKLAGEHYTRVYNELYGLKTSIVRYASVYGPRQRPDIDYAAVIPKFVSAILKNQPVTVYGDGAQLRPFTFIEDAVEGTLKVLESKSANGEAFNIANSKQESVMDIVRVLERISGKNASVKFIKGPLNELKTNPIDTSKAQKLLDFKAKRDLKYGISKMYEYMAQI